MLIRVFKSEAYKLLKSKVWYLIFIGPLFCFLIGNYYANLGDYSWMDIFSRMIGIYGIYLLPLLTGIITAFTCRYEHDQKNWKLYLTMPIRKSVIYLVKFTLSFSLTAVTQGFIFFSLFLIKIIHEISEPLPYSEILTSLGYGWLTSAPLIALMLLISAHWKNFTAPILINAVLTIPNLLIAPIPSIAPLYPWAYPLLSMTISDKSLIDTVNPHMYLVLGLIIGMILVIIGTLTFSRKQVN